MKVKGLYTMDTLPERYIVQALDGSYYYFNCAPYRRIEAKDLHPLAAATGLHRAAMDETLYKHYCGCYGLEIDGGK